jgi:PAS domain S-box-containing protein
MAIHTTSGNDPLTEQVRDLIIDAALDAIICMDTNGIITLWNRQAEKIFGWGKDEVIGLALEQTIIPEGYRSMHTKALKQYLASRERGKMINRLIEITAIDRNGREFPVELTITPIQQNGSEFFCAFIRDITGRKRAEQEVLRANERFSLITRATNDIVWDWNLITDEIFWNENYYSLFGYDPSTTPSTSESRNRGIHPDDKQRILDKVNEAIESRQQLWYGEYRFLKADGTILFIYDRGFIQYDSNNRAVRMLGAMMDISERKKAEADLIESENRLRTIIQTEPECIKLLSYDCKLLEMNPAGLGMIEADSIEKVRGLSVLPLLKPHHRKTFAGLVRDVFNGNSSTMKFELVGLKGTERWIETHMVPMRNAGGDIISLLSVSRDITDQKKSEESLRKAEEQYRHIFENTLDGIYQSTPGGRFITANPAMAKMFGFDSPAEMIDSIVNIGEEIYADPSERLRMKFLLEEHGQANGFELLARKKNSELIWVRANIRAVCDIQGALKYYEGTVEDISERRSAEEKLQKQFQEIQKTNYELDRFVYSVSHDLRAPLASILGIINIAELEKISPTVREYMGMVRSSVNRLDTFINDILNYSRNSRMEVSYKRTDFRTLLAETQNNLKLIEGAGNIEVIFEIQDAAPFYSDSARIAIILNNLFSNSIKYQDRYKKSSFLNVNIVTDPEKAVITVTDNGIGIPADHVGKIFNMFYRASDVSKGSGLGLYITKETIVKLGGTVEVKSEFGAFTTFEIILPNQP